jgi:anti-anti-sigma factor
MVDINTSLHNQVSLIEVAGRVDSSTAPKLGEALNGELNSGRMRLVLDLSAVDYMSSAGLRELVNALKRARSQGDLRLASPSERVLDVLEMAGLDEIFQIFHSQAEAIQSY